MAEKKRKISMAVYWGAACGGCCVSVLDVHETLFDVIDVADFVFWPIILDTKYEDLENIPDGYIDLTLYNGAIRNSENEHMAKLLRQKSKILIAYGSCAHMGGIPGLANFTTRKDLFDRVYLRNESTSNTECVLPQTYYEVEEGILELPEFYNDVRALSDVVEVDYFIPGCPPQTARLVEVFTAIVTGTELPPSGSVIGAGNKALCDECMRKKTGNKAIKKLRRPWEVEDDGVTCFLEQGLLCMGPTTRSGCDYRCVKGNAPCRGCYGPTPEVTDPGTKMMSALASIIDEKTSAGIETVLEDMVDPAGYFYRYSLPSSYLRRTIS